MEQKKEKATTKSLLKNKIFITSLSLNLFALICLVLLIIKRIKYNRLPEISYKSWHQERVDLFKHLPIDTSDFVFVGNSLIERFPLHEMLHIENIKNRGISGDKSVDILNRIEDVARAKPAKIFLEGSINDIINKHSVDSAIYNIKLVINRIRQLSPNSKIYFHSVLPTAKFIDEIKIYNKQLDLYCSLNKVTFIDLYGEFLSKEKTHIDTALTTDGLHLNYSGYKKWAIKLESYVSK